MHALVGNEVFAVCGWLCFPGCFVGCWAFQCFPSRLQFFMCAFIVLIFHAILSDATSLTVVWACLLSPECIPREPVAAVKRNLWYVIEMAHTVCNRLGALAVKTNNWLGKHISTGCSWFDFRGHCCRWAVAARSLMRKMINSYLSVPFTPRRSRQLPVRFFHRYPAHNKIQQEGVWETIKIERYVSVVGVKPHSGNL